MVGDDNVQTAASYLNAFNCNFVNVEMRYSVDTDPYMNVTLNSFNNMQFQRCKLAGVSS